MSSVTCTSSLVAADDGDEVAADDGNEADDDIPVIRLQALMHSRCLDARVSVSRVCQYLSILHLLSILINAVSNSVSVTSTMPIQELTRRARTMAKVRNCTTTEYVRLFNLIANMSFANCLCKRHTNPILHEFLAEGE